MEGELNSNIGLEDRATGQTMHLDNEHFIVKRCFPWEADMGTPALTPAFSSCHPRKGRYSKAGMHSDISYLRVGELGLRLNLF